MTSATAAKPKHDKKNVILEIVHASEEGRNRFVRDAETKVCQFSSAIDILGSSVLL